MTPKAVRDVRKKLELSQSKFASVLGVHKVTVARWETGALGLSASSERLIRMLDKHGPEAIDRAMTPPTRKRGRKR